MNLNDITRKLIDDSLNNLHTALPAKINKYDPEKMRAEVTLLNKKKLEGESVEIPPIIEVPVAHFNAGPFVIRPPYKKDDTVQVLFNEKALDKLLISGKPEKVKYTRKHSFDDAVVIQGLKTEQEDDLPAEELESLYIANLDKNVKLFINPDGTFRIANDEKKTEIVIESDGVMRLKDISNGTELKFDISTGDAIFTLATKLLLGSSGASEGVPLGNSLKDWLDNHTHGGVATGGGTTSKPSSTSPSPSSKVLVE